MDESKATEDQRQPVDVLAIKKFPDQLRYIQALIRAIP